MIKKHKIASFFLCETLKHIFLSAAAHTCSSFHVITMYYYLSLGNGSFSLVTYTTVRAPSPAGTSACINVTNYLWEGQSAFRVSITKVTPTIGMARVGTPSSANVLVSNAGKIILLMCNDYKSRGIVLLKIHCTNLHTSM